MKSIRSPSNQPLKLLGEEIFGLVFNHPYPIYQIHSLQATPPFQTAPPLTVPSDPISTKLTGSTLQINYP